ncbi:hypothetical protein [Nocardioides sp. B-3]|uniref:hypothetical protein n=1 Tax=Nocardioides sp. B-3 TaxID=2895565 RepID=UPI002151FE60|nr:hypothetical protein [Nocardioides sp. B-3]UUZ59430.1 hypothetical protein LP418_27170 [Nocardioides sp. B-3]
MGGRAGEHSRLAVLGRLRYDWSDPTVVRWTIVESSYGGHGTGSVRIAPSGDGGSRLGVEWTYTDITRTRDKIMLPMIQRFPMNRLIARMWVGAPGPFRSVPESG